MSRSSLKPKFSLKKREFFLFCLVLCAVAVFFHLKHHRADVTVSGLNLQDTRETVGSHMKSEDFRGFQLNGWEEQWSRMESPTLSVTYDHQGSVTKLEGGVPEINGDDATHWTVGQLEAALGPAPLTGQSSAVGETRRGHLSYPDHRLLIYLETSGNRFLLFESARDQ